MKQRKQTSRSGRRAGQGRDQSRDAILAAARHAFAAHGYRATTLKQIAVAAEVTPAMVNYHFGSKQGLYLAVVGAVAEPLLARMAELKQSQQQPGGIEQFFEIYMKTLAANPELPALVMQDVLSTDGPMRKMFASQFAARGRDAVRALLEKDRKQGRLDPALDIRLTSIAVISLAIFPFLAAPLIREVFDVEYDDRMIDQLIENNRRLFMRGARKPK